LFVCGDICPWHTDNSDEVSDEESQASDKFYCISATTGTKKDHLYNESHLSMVFSWTGDSSHPIPLSLVCGKRLKNATMSPEKLK
jgi:hypothetical protein